MSCYWNAGSDEPLLDVKDRLEKMTVEDKAPKLLRRMYTKKHMDYLLNKKAKRPVAKSNVQDSLLNFNEQLKNMQNILELQNQFGVSIEQKNGQRKLGGRPAGSNGPQPGPGCEIFVGKIPRNIYEDVIYPIFRQVGDIYEIRLMMNFSGSNRGFCFIMYEKPEMAQRAIRELNNYQIRPGWYIGVVESVNNCRLHVTDLPPQIDTKVLIKIKHALISFKTHRSAAMARRRLLPERHVFFDKPDARIEWAHPKISVTNVIEESGLCDSNNDVVITKLIIKNDRNNLKSENPGYGSFKNKRLLPIDSSRASKSHYNLDVIANNSKNEYVSQLYDNCKYPKNLEEPLLNIAKCCYEDRNLCSYLQTPHYYINSPTILNTSNCSVMRYPWLSDDVHWNKVSSAIPNKKDPIYAAPTLTNNDNFYNVKNVKPVVAAKPILNYSSYLSNQYRPF